MTDSLPLGDRQHRAKIHGERIKALLDSKPKKETAQRLFRARVFLEDMLVFTLVQNLNLPLAPGQPDIKVHVFVSRPYTTAGSMGATVVRMDLAGPYSVDEIVAFLALDKLDDDAVHWIDETKYSAIVVVGGDIVKALH